MPSFIVLIDEPLACLLISSGLVAQLRHSLGCGIVFKSIQFIEHCCYLSAKNAALRRARDWVRGAAELVKPLSFEPKHELPRLDLRGLLFPDN